MPGYYDESDLLDKLDELEDSGADAEAAADDFQAPQSPLVLASARNPEPTAPPNPELSNYMPDPKIIEAIRSSRNQNIALNSISKGLTQIGAGIAGQKADTSAIDDLDKAAQQKALEAMQDQKNGQAAVLNYIKQKREDAKLTDLNKRRDELTGIEKMNAETNLRRASATEKLANRKADQADERLDQGEGRLDLRKSQFEDRQYANVLNKIDRDPILKTKMQALQTIDSSAQLVAKAREEGKPVSKQQFEELQQGIISSLGQKGVQIGSERMAKMFSSAGIDAKAALQFLLGKPIDIGKDNPLYNHVMDLARWESDISRQQMNDHLNRLTAGNGYIFDKRQDLKDGLAEKLGAFRKESETTNFKPGAGDPSLHTGTALSPKDQEALDWANAHPTDGRAAKIKARLGR